MDGVISSREDIRREMARLRLQISPEERACNDTRIANAILSTKLWSGCDHIFAYCAMAGEPDLRVLMETALDEGKTLALPKCLDGERMDFYRVTSPDELDTGMYGIREPVRCDRDDLMEPDRSSLILIPCLAYDTRGYRLGHGKGYYDRYLARTDRQAETMIVAYRLQQTEGLSAVKEDIPAAWIATEGGVMPSRQYDGY